METLQTFALVLDEIRDLQTRYRGLELDADDLHQYQGRQRGLDGWAVANHFH